jgi:hypothetical protein
MYVIFQILFTSSCFNTQSYVRNVYFQEYERRKLKKARDIQKLSKASTSDNPEGEGNIYRDEDRFEVQDDSNPVFSTLAPSIVEKGKQPFSKLRTD